MPNFALLNHDEDLLDLDAGSFALDGAGKANAKDFAYRSDYQRHDAAAGTAVASAVPARASRLGQFGAR